MTNEEAIEEVKGKILRRLEGKRKSAWDAEVCAKGNGFSESAREYRICKETYDKAIKIVEEEL